MARRQNPAGRRGVAEGIAATDADAICAGLRRTKLARASSSDVQQSRLNAKLIAGEKVPRISGHVRVECWDEVARLRVGCRSQFSRFALALHFGTFTRYQPAHRIRGRLEEED